jgi:hypothetical protein
MKSKLCCPACQEYLTKELHPAKSAATPKPYVLLFCENPRCISHVANHEGGSGPTEQAAYRALCFAVDNETEQECDPWDGESEVDRRERLKDQIAERLNDMERAGGP